MSLDRRLMRLESELDVNDPLAFISHLSFEDLSILIHDVTQAIIADPATPKEKRVQALADLPEAEKWITRTPDVDARRAALYGRADVKAGFASLANDHPKGIAT